MLSGDTVGQATTYVFNSATNLGVAVGVLQSKLQKSTAKFDVNSVIVDERYIERPELEKRIKDFLNRKIDSEDYAIVAGPKGIGKTTVVYHATKEMTGIVVVKVTDGDKNESILKNLVEACGINVSQDTTIKENLVSEALNKEFISNPDKPIKIVIEVERGGDVNNSTILKTVSSLAKSFAHYANVLIVVSEANATLGFTNDAKRQKVIWVDDMTSAQALAYLKKRNVIVDAQFIKPIEDAIGFQAIDLSDLCLEIKTYYENQKYFNAFHGSPSSSNSNIAAQYNVQAFIDNRVAMAKTDLKKFALFPILTELKANPNGVSTDVFVGKEFEGVNLADPAQVFKLMKETNVVMYHSPSDEYRLISKAHATALKNYAIPEWSY